MDTVLCECCQRPGGLLTQCAHVDEDGNGRRKCQIFQHTLCAELCDRERIIVNSDNGDLIFYKCALHSFGEDAICVVCRFGSRQNSMLECDGCSNGYHMDCLPTPLTEVPEGDWFCPKCKPENHKVVVSKKSTSTTTIKKEELTKIETKKEERNKEEKKVLELSKKESIQKAIEAYITTDIDNMNTTTPPPPTTNVTTSVKSTIPSLEDSNKKIDETVKEQVVSTTELENKENDSETKQGEQPDNEILEISDSESAYSTELAETNEPELVTPRPLILLKKNQTADSFPIGDPLLDYSLVDKMQEMKKD